MLFQLKINATIELISNPECFFFNDTATTEIYTLSLHDALPILIPLGRRGSAEDVAPLVVFLISDESSWISGAEIAVDGGQAAHGGMKQLSDAVRAATEAAASQ